MNDDQIENYTPMLQVFVSAHEIKPATPSLN